jgi:hypothetical protein
VRSENTRKGSIFSISETPAAHIDHHTDDIIKRDRAIRKRHSFVETITRRNVLVSEKDLEAAKDHDAASF